MAEQVTASDGFIFVCSNGHEWLGISTSLEKTREMVLDGQTCSICKTKAVDLFDLDSEKAKACLEAQASILQNLSKQQLSDSDIDDLVRLKR